MFNGQFRLHENLMYDKKLAKVNFAESLRWPSRAINGVPTPTLTLQLSHCNELANGEDDVLSNDGLAQALCWFCQLSRC